MRRFFVFLTLVALLFSNTPAKAQAQANLDYDSVAVSIWPEFDNDQALVIYRLSLSQKTTLPAEIELRVPSTVDRLWTIAVGDSFETVSDAGVDYQFKNGDAFSTITLTAKSRFIQIEFYDGIKKTDKTRDYTYQWNGDGAIGTFQFELRQPLQSADLKIAPALSAPVIDPEGFAVSSDTKINVQNGEKIIYKFSYTRETNDPSTSFLQVSANNNAPVSSPSGNFLDFLPWILGGLGALFLIVAGFLYFTSGRNRGESGDSRKRHTNRGTSHAPSAADPSAVAHCPECGNRSKPGDKFCRTCGAKLKG